MAHMLILASNDDYELSSYFEYTYILDSSLLGITYFYFSTYSYIPFFPRGT